MGSRTCSRRLTPHEPWTWRAAAPAPRGHPATSARCLHAPSGASPEQPMASEPRAGTGDRAPGGFAGSGRPMADRRRRPAHRGRCHRRWSTVAPPRFDLRTRAQGTLRHHSGLSAPPRPRPPRPHPGRRARPGPARPTSLPQPGPATRDEARWACPSRELGQASHRTPEEPSSPRDTASDPDVGDCGGSPHRTRLGGFDRQVCAEAGGGRDHNGLGGHGNTPSTLDQLCYGPARRLGTSRPELHPRWTDGGLARQ